MSTPTVLVANRGEIALRILCTAHRLGFRSVAVYSDADALAPHVAAAERAVRIGPAPVSESYLDIERILDAARRTGATHIHPGYGFLSENAAFAQACADAGLIFVGPSAKVIALMGDKRAAKQTARDAGVPCIPGYDGAEQSTEDLTARAAEVGYPLMVKAAAGGGGRGIRLVEKADDLPEALRSARSEAEAAFGDGALLLERAILAPRHVEIQVFGDTHGNVVHLGERDCSVQRRHQKVIEEAPSPAVDNALRKQMGEAAVALASAVGYVGAGTVEMLLDAEGSFYFLEMNTRLQVEHPVTEAITGQDLVAWQLNVALGHVLPLSQDAITFTGHAVEARLYAEDPRHDFRPQAGVLHSFTPYHEAAWRVDSGVASGAEISPYYDPMIAKVVTHGRDREEAFRKLATTLRRTRAVGLPNNRAFLTALCEHPVLRAGEATTAFISEHFSNHPTTRPLEPTDRHWGLACAALLELSKDTGWRSSSAALPSFIKLRCGEHEQELEVAISGRSLTVGTWSGEVLDQGAERLIVLEDGVQSAVPCVRNGHTVYLGFSSGAATFTDISHEPPASASLGAGSGRIVGLFAGRVVHIHVAEGDRVEPEALLLVVEAMKMEQEIRADVAGIVKAVHIEAGVQIKERELLIEIEPEEASE